MAILVETEPPAGATGNQRKGKTMARTETLRPNHNLRLLLLQEHGVGEDPMVWEMDYDGGSLPGDPRHSPEKLHNWLAAKHICPCEPRRYAEKELARKMEELSRSNHELERFAYVASHDLREPLRMVATYTQLLAERYRGKLDKSADQYIDYATDGALRMQALIQDLLDLSRVGSEDIKREDIDCNLALDEVLRDMDSAIRESGGAVSHGKLPVVTANRCYIQQLFQNLIGNAIKFRNKREPLVISVTAEPQGQYWRFSVNDNGIGIEPECQESIFTAFQRLHARTEYPGNGIGLAICKKIVEYYGGRIWVASQPERGSNFMFTLPATYPGTGEES
jgi:light-regulated signal transduction histidine kinase (bacteriophytochrome)